MSKLSEITLPEINVYGFPVVFTTDAIEKQEVLRTWKERLFSLPWRPLVKIRVVYKPAIFQVGNRFLVHPALKNQLLANLKDGEA